MHLHFAGRIPFFHLHLHNSERPGEVEPARQASHFHEQRVLSYASTQLKPILSELERIETSLYAARKALAAEEVELQKVSAQRAVTEQQLAGLKVTTEVSAREMRGGIRHSSLEVCCWTVILPGKLQKAPAHCRELSRSSRSVWRLCVAQ
jgi:hypothetical protein